MYKNGIIESVKQNIVIIRLEDNQIVHWHLGDAPCNFSQGENIVLEVKKKSQSNKSQQVLAKQVLNEIFNGEQKENAEETQ